MNIVLLSGGSGKRLWPLSNDIRSKQFLKLFLNENGTYESMVQRMYRQIIENDSTSDITIATSEKQVDIIRNQLGNNIDISIEPSRKDTFPAIVLSALYLKYVKNIDENESIIVCPVDQLVEDDYFKCLQIMVGALEQTHSDIVLMGVKPTYPSEKYGYILPKDQKDVTSVFSFKEKPNKAIAEKYIESGALWNGGVFAFKLKYILKLAHSFFEFCDYTDFYNNYEKMQKISFDYAVVEKAKDITVVKFVGSWSDLGNWNALTSVMKRKNIGKFVLSKKCTNTHIINELNIPIIALGLDDIVISASHEGILVSKKRETDLVKSIASLVKQKTKFEEKTWGEFLILSEDENSLVAKVVLNSKQKIFYDSRGLFEEIWIVLNGSGYTVLDGVKEKIKSGSVVFLSSNNICNVYATKKLTLMKIEFKNKIITETK